MKKKYNSDKGHRKEKKTFHKRDDRKKGRDERKSYGDRKEERGRGDDRKSDRPFRKGDDRKRERYHDERKEHGHKEERGGGFDRKSDRPFRKGDDRKRERYHDERKEHGHKEERGGGFDRKSDRPFRRGNDRRRPFNKKWKPENIKKAFTKSDNLTSSPSFGSTSTASEQIRLNKYLSNAGICSRREADKFITAGVVTVNGKIITELGYKVNPNDKIQFGGNKVNKEKTVYILLNKPKGYITTCDDPQERDTVMDLIKEVQERVYPVGRLDRQTSGLLLLTNDGDLTTKLMHPKYNVPKVYHIELDKPLRTDDFDKIKAGIELEDGFIKPDDIAYVEGAKTRKEIGIEIHSGRNRIVRRIFESLGYIVMKLDRVLYAGLTKQTLSRGKWRYLADNEVRMLKRIK